MRGVTLAGGVPPEKGKVSAGEKAGFLFDISVRVSNYRKRRSCAGSLDDAVRVTEYMLESRLSRAWMTRQRADSNGGLTEQGNTMAEATASLVALMFFIGLAAWGILLLFVGVQETLRLFTSLADPRVLRRAVQFRLRSLLLLAAVLQIAFAVVAWNQEEGKPLAAVFFSLACVAFFAWTIGAAFEGCVSPTTSRRWKRHIGEHRIAVPDDGGPTPPPRRDIRKT